jgi:two-component system, NtrC family, response regulator AtoC
LSVTEDGSTVTYPLLASGMVVIGRADGCDLVLRNPLVSREHAVLHLGETLEIEDLGSANGTSLGSRRLEPRTRVPLARGQVVFMGAVALTVQDGQDAVAEPPQMVSQEALEQHLQALAGARHPATKGVGIVRARTSGALRPEYVTLLVAQALEPEDRLAVAVGAGFHLVLPRSSAAKITATITRIQDRLRDWDVTIDAQHRFVAVAENGPDDLLAAAAALFVAPETITLARGTVVVSSPAMRHLFQLVDRVAPGDISVLVTGETGAGKDVIASAIHECSPRRARPFLRINCASLSPTLLESELFGHEAGAFTGARGAKPGLLETARGGTVFLDEVGEMPLAIQAKILHALESREVTRVGGLVARPIDVRFVAATNRELEQAVSEGTFRRDLYFRLNGLTLAVPPLRERRSEIALLVRLFIHNACRQLARTEPVVTATALVALEGHAWPGNVRELKNVIDRALLLCPADEIGVEDLSFGGRAVAAATSPSPVGTAAGTATAAAALRPPADGVEVQRARILVALEACAGNQSRAAEMLRMPRRTLVKRLAAYDIPRPQGARTQARAKAGTDRVPSNGGFSSGRGPHVDGRPPE